MSKVYLTYDGRARTNTDDATVLAVALSIYEAKADCQLFIDGPIDFDPVVFSYTDSGDALTDEKLEYDPKEPESTLTA